MGKDNLNDRHLAEGEMMLIELEERFEFTIPTTGRCTSPGTDPSDPSV